MPVACSGKKDAIPIRLARHFVTVLSSLRGPGPGTLVLQLVLLGPRRRAPSAAPIGTGGIIRQVQAGLVIYRTMSTIPVVLAE